MPKRKIKNESTRESLIVLRCQISDEKAFEELYNRYGSKTYNYLKTMVDDLFIDDIQQNIWLIVFNKIHRLKNPENFRSWLYSVTRFEALDYIRSRKYLVKFRKEFAEEISSSIVGSDLNQSPNKEISSKLSEVINKLPSEHKEVIFLKYLDGLSYEEISMVVGCPIGTVRSRLHYAKSEIKKLFTKTLI